MIHRNPSFVVDVEIVCEYETMILIVLGFFGCAFVLTKKLD